MSDKMIKTQHGSNPTIFDLFSRPLADFGFMGGRNDSAFSMSTDVIDKGDRYQLKTDLPGVRKEDIKVDFKDGVLTISAERKFERNGEDGEGFVVRERSEGSYSRRFSFDDVDPEQINAAFHDGELDISLKKLERTQGRSISIN